MQQLSFSTKRSSFKRDGLKSCSNANLRNARSGMLFDDESLKLNENSMLRQSPKLSESKANK